MHTKGEWGQRVYQDGRPLYWNNYSGGALVRFETEAEAHAHCEESNKGYLPHCPGRESRPERIPARKTREPSEIEAVMLLMRDALQGRANKDAALAECATLFARLGWGKP